MEKKIRICVYLSKEEKLMLDELLIKRIRQGETPSLTSTFCDALAFYHEHEIVVEN